MSVQDVFHLKQQYARLDSSLEGLSRENVVKLFTEMGSCLLFAQKEDVRLPPALTSQASAMLSLTARHTYRASGDMILTQL
jgi:hypothetical protein